MGSKRTCVVLKKFIFVWILILSGKRKILFPDFFVMFYAVEQGCKLCFFVIILDKYIRETII